MLKITGKCCSREAAVAFVKNLYDLIPEAVKTHEFQNAFEESMNRISYEVAKGIPRPPKVTPAIIKRYGVFYHCSKCGTSLTITDDYCRKCGTAILWDNPRCLTKGTQI